MTDQDPEGEAPALQHSKMVRMSDADVRRLRTLARRLELKEAAVIRRAIRELAKKEGLE